MPFLRLDTFENVFYGNTNNKRRGERGQDYFEGDEEEVLHERSLLNIEYL